MLYWCHYSKRGKAYERCFLIDSVCAGSIRFYAIFRQGWLAKSRPLRTPKGEGAGNGRLVPALHAAALWVCVFLSVNGSLDLLFYLGSILYALGILFCARSVYDFSFPNAQGFCAQGIYRHSRNPMYVSYALLFLGMAFLCRSWILLLILLLFQVSGQYIILAEERWCLARFGQAYQSYMQQVRRYL